MPKVTAKSRYLGLRKPDDPIYKQVSIVVGGPVRKVSSKQLRERKTAKPKQPDEEPEIGRRSRKSRPSADEQ